MSITRDPAENPIVGGKLYARDAYVYPNETKNLPAAVTDSELYMGKPAIPIVYDHMHINYGMWNKLKLDGSNLPLDLGIGFVNVLEDKTKTPVADRPTGTANYKGGWAAAMRAKGAVDSTAFSNHAGLSKVTANFDDNSVTADLLQAMVNTRDVVDTPPFTPTTVAKFTGAIDGTGFMGTKIANVGDLGGLTTADDGDGYTSEFSGAFYGPEAEETGGIFDFDGEKKGALRGAFGGGKGEYGAEASEQRGQLAVCVHPLFWSAGPVPSGERAPLLFVPSTKFVVDYFRCTADHRLLFGGGETYSDRPLADSRHPPPGTFSFFEPDSPCGLNGNPVPYPSVK